MDKVERNRRGGGEVKLGGGEGERCEEQLSCGVVM